MSSGRAPLCSIGPEQGQRGQGTVGGVAPLASGEAIALGGPQMRSRAENPSRCPQALPTTNRAYSKQGLQLSLGGKLAMGSGWWVENRERPPPPH